MWLYQQPARCELSLLCGAGAEIQNSASYKFCPPTHRSFAPPPNVANFINLIPAVSEPWGFEMNVDTAWMGIWPVLQVTLAEMTETVKEWNNECMWHIGWQSVYWWMNEWIALHRVLNWLKIKLNFLTNQSLRLKTLQFTLRFVVLNYITSLNSFQRDCLLCPVRACVLEFNVMDYRQRCDCHSFFMANVLLLSQSWDHRLAVVCASESCTHTVAIPPTLLHLVH